MVQTHETDGRVKAEYFRNPILGHWLNPEYVVRNPQDPDKKSLPAWIADGLREAGVIGSDEKLLEEARAKLKEVFDLARGEKAGSSQEVRVAKAAELGQVNNVREILEETRTSYGLRNAVKALAYIAAADSMEVYPLNALHTFRDGLSSPKLEYSGNSKVADNTASDYLSAGITCLANALFSPGKSQK